jgi:Zn-dependent protease with chaperone function
VEALLYDGLTARPWPARVSLDGDRVVAVSEALDAAGAPCARLDWPLAKVREQERDETSYRLTHAGGDARLIVDIQAWQALTGRTLRQVVRRRRGGEWRVIGGLAVAGLSVMVFVFVVVPLAAEPLARWTPPGLEARFGRSMQAQVNLAMPVCDGDPQGSAVLARLGETLSEGADTRFPIRVKAVRAPFVNAFALPGGTVMVTDELIDQAGSPDELAGVLAHEIAHVERRHVMQAAWRSMGAGLILDAVVGGGSGAGQQAILLASSLSNQRFSRKLEAEADARGMQLLARQGVSSQGMADFFDRMADRKADARVRQAAEWFSSHPDMVARAALAKAAARPGRPALSDADWKRVKAVCKAPRKR